MLALFLPAGILIGMGLVMLSTLSLHLFTFQIVWVALAAGIVFLFTKVDARAIFNSRWVVWGGYGAAVLLMLVALVASPLVRNTHSWIVIGPFTLQPVEFMKIALILLFANYFSRRHLAIARWQTILVSFAFFVVPAVIAIKLPDLSSAIIFFFVWFGFLIFLGLPFRRVAVAIAIFILVGVLAWNVALKGYQRARIAGYLSPKENALGINYSVTQSEIAIGDSGWFGKGYGQGTQTQLGFLSEPTEDFMFSAVVEEWGFLGGVLVSAAFLFLIFAILRIGTLADENFEKFVCMGTAIMFAAQFLLNAGSATGLTPVVGVTFPFLSYGGSSMLADGFMLAVINSIRKRLA